jgi:hypothetical protein
MILGGVLLMVSLFGFRALKARRWLSIYTILLAMLIIAHAAIGYLTYRGILSSDNTLKSVWADSSVDQRAWFQQNNQCCGFETPQDQPAVSDTCPANGATTLPGCYESMSKLFTTQRAVAVYSLLGFVALEVVVFLISCLLLCRGQSSEEDQRLQQVGFFIFPSYPFLIIRALR